MIPKSDGVLDGFYQLLLQQHVELQQLGVAELLAAGEGEVLLEEGAAPARIPMQLAQQCVALAEQL